MRLGIILFLLLTTISYGQDLRSELDEKTNPFYPTSKPLTRWWWFATDIKKSDIKHQLDWAKKHNFGGVEIAWVYPLYRYQRMYKRSYGRHYPKDNTAAKWLSKEWSDDVVYTKKYSDSIGLACDFTFGSAWPVAGLNIDKAHSSRIYGDSSHRQLLTFSWAWPDTMYVINHLDKNAFELFSKPIEEALVDALKGSKSAFFTDSWEIKLNSTNKIWTPGFDSTFLKDFGYDIIPYMNQGIDSFPDVRYDYMLHLDDYVTEGFYKPYVDKCKQLGAWSRVQCLAAPADVMTTYSLVDIPETEAMLNNPNYSRIVSSSACLASKPMVSSETFTCMYGFPATYLHQEQTADLKMVADALFAQGVNQHVYHGMPYNTLGSDTNTFFATTYFGPGGSITPELADFNSYIERVSGILQQGKTYSDVAVYIPYEDGVMKGAYPAERQRVWVWGEYELRYVFTPKELEGYHPLWINRHFLENAAFVEGKLVVGDAKFSSLYIDINYMDIRSLERIIHFAKQGLPICLKQDLKQPGLKKSDQYSELLNDLKSLGNVSSQLKQVVKHPPLLEGKDLPPYWSRVMDDGTTLIFMAQPKAKNLAYPIYSGQSFASKICTKRIKVHVKGTTHKLKLKFKPYQSLVLQVKPSGDLSYLDIKYLPKHPVVKPQEKQRMNF